MPYEMPNWIRPPADLAAKYMEGVQTGAQIAHQKQALQQQAQVEALNASLRQQQLSQQNQVEQQRIQVESAYNQQLAELKKQQLDQVAAMNAVKIQDAQRQFALRQLYQQRVAAGEDPSRVMLELGPSLGEGEQAMAGAFKAQAAKRVLPPASMQTIGGERFLSEPQVSGNVRYQHITTEKPMSDAERMRLEMSAYNMMKVGPSELPDDPQVKERVAQAKGMLKKLRGDKPADTAAIAQRAHSAIAAGADADKVRARYKELTGEDLE